MNKQDLLCINSIVFSYFVVYYLHFKRFQKAENAIRLANDVSSNARIYFRLKSVLTWVQCV